MASDQAGLTKIRAEVARALDEFLTRQRAGLAAIGDDMLPWIDTMTGLLGGGKRLRPAFCYWGWRAAGGPDCPQIYTAAAALELLHASALVHDDVMDASDTRRGRPAVHRQFASRLAQAGFGDGADAFGAGAAILIGDVLLSWTDELYHSSGLPPEVLQRGQPVLDAMRTEVAAGQYLDLVNQVTRSDSVESAMRVVRYKTAKYTIERPLHLGAAMAGAGRGRGRRLHRLRDTAGHRVPAPRRHPRDLRRPGHHRQAGDRGHQRGQADRAHGARDGARELGSAPACSTGTWATAGCTEAGAAEVRAVITDTGALDECETLIDASVKEATAALDGALITEEAREALTELAVLSTARAD